LQHYASHGAHKTQQILDVRMILKQLPTLNSFAMFCWPHL